jgi:hypothetical protein
MNGHRLVIDVAEDGLTQVTFDGKEIGTTISEIEFRHRANGSALLRFVSVVPNPPMPDLSKEDGRVERTHDGHIEVTFGAR